MTSAPGLPPADLLPVQRRATATFRVLRLVVEPLLRLLFRWRIEGRENIPLTGAFVVIANHLGWLDPFALVLAFPNEPKIHFLGNPVGLVRHHVQWRVVRAVGGYIAVDPKQHGDRALNRAVDLCLERGGAVALFPEGHYGPAEGFIEPFHKGFAHFATRNRVPVVPVALTGTQDLWLGKPVRVVIGEPIPPGTDVDTVVQEAQRRLAVLLPGYSDPGGRRLLRRRLTHLF